MANGPMLAEPAFAPIRILGDSRRRPLRLDHPPSLVQQSAGGGAVGAHPLDMQRVGILAYCHVEGTGEVRQVHVDLHLRPVPLLRCSDALGDEVAETLGRMRLELDYVPGPGRLPEA